MQLKIRQQQQFKFLVLLNDFWLLAELTALLICIGLQAGKDIYHSRYTWDKKKNILYEYLRTLDSVNSQEKLIIKT